jgi:predicted ATPase/class 3 adenylate cyclase/uncharacterized protein HemY
VIGSQWYTFLFTDIAGSTKLWEAFPREMDKALFNHDHLLNQVIDRHGGHVFKMVGDAVHAIFESPMDALDAAVESQRALMAGPKVEDNLLSVRMALHAGMCLEREGDYFGPTVNRISRLLAAAYGGQVILSRAVNDALEGRLPDGVKLRDLGQHRLKDLGQPEHIYQVMTPGLPEEFPPLRTLDFRPHNLPTSTSTFVGRAGEIEELQTLLATSRLLTLTGPGGIGKSRLALQVAAELVDEYSDGVFFVTLAALRDQSLLPKSIADALQVPISEKKNAANLLTKYLMQRQLLLILDNFEHVISAGSFLGKLLMTCPDLRIMVTSRQRLDIYGEYEYPVPVMNVPGEILPQDWRMLAINDAVSLFLQRAQAAKPEFDLTAENVEDVVNICRNLDGLPLAIELAAPRVRFFAPASLNQKLDSRLGFLTSGPRDAPARQRTLRRAIEWSYDLLDSTEKRLFQRLGIFTNGWTLEAAERTCVDVPNGDRLEPAGQHVSRKIVNVRPEVIFDVLTSLVDKSLVQINMTGDEDPRFYMLGTIREYAFECLAKGDELEFMHRRHLHYFMNLAEGEEDLLEQMAPKTVKQLSAEHDNFAAALAWSLDKEQREVTREDRLFAGRLVIALRMYWYIRGYLEEGRRWLDLSLNQAKERDIIRAKALLANGMLAWQQGDYGLSQADLEESASIFREIGDKPGLAEAVHYLGHLAFDQCDYQGAQAYFEESLQLFQALGDQIFSLILLSDTGMVAYHQHDLETARKRFEKALEGFRLQGRESNAADQLNRLGDIARMNNEYEKAASFYEESLNLFREFDDTLGIASCLHKLGQVCLHHGNFSQARARFCDSLTLQQEMGNKQGIGECLAAFAGLAGNTGNYEVAARLGAVTELFLEELGAPLSPADRLELTRVQEVVLEEVGVSRYGELCLEGRSLTLDEGLSMVRQNFPQC